MATFQKRGEKWRVMVRRKGHDPISRTFDSRDAGKKWADELEGRISGETYVDRSEAKATRLRGLIERYRDEVTPGKKGAKQEGYRLAAWLADPMADWSAVSVLPKDIAAWRRQREAEGKAPSTINNAVNLLSAVYKVAATEWGLPITNPCAGVRRAAQRAAREAHLTPESEAALLEHCGRPAWLRPLVVTAIETGMRQGELRALTWSDIDLVAGIALLRDTKNGQVRRVPLSERTRITLIGWRQAQGEEAPAPFPTIKETIAHAWVAAIERAAVDGVPAITFHDLRHVAATRLAARLQPLELARVLGHKTLSMTLRYYNPKAADLTAKIDGREEAAAGVLEQFRTAVERVKAAGLDPQALLNLLQTQEPSA